MPWNILADSGRREVSPFKMLLKLSSVIAVVGACDDTEVRCAVTEHAVCAFGVLLHSTMDSTNACAGTQNIDVTSDIPVKSW